MNKRRNFIFAIILSVLIHFFALLGSFFFEEKLNVVDRNKEKIIEIIPYYPLKDLPKRQLDRDFKAYGKDDIKTGEENKLPEISRAIPKILEDFREKDVLKESNNTENIYTQFEELPKVQEKIIDIKKEDDKKTKEDLKLKEERDLPDLKRLIPKSTDLLARLPKEESISLDTGTIKGSKELILNTKEYKYWSYLEKVKRKVEAVWRYPDIARERGIGGRLKIAFTITKEGKIENKVLLQSSGYSFLDDAAMKALRDASPLAPFPKEWDIEKINIDGTFIYEINVIK